MHVTDIRKFNRCPRLYQRSQKEESSHFSFFNIPFDVCGTVAGKLHLEDYRTGVVNNTNADSFTLAQECPYVFRARFEFDGLRIKVPLIKLEADHCIIYDFVLSTSVTTDEYINMKYYLFVLENLGIKVDKIYTLYLNREYRRGEELDCDQLWILSEFRNRDTTVLDYVRTLETDTAGLLRRIRCYKDEHFSRYTPKCTGRNRCSYFEECYPQYADIPDNSILTLVSSQYKYRMFDLGVRYLKDAPEVWLESNRVQLSQIAADRNGGLYVDEPALAKWLDGAISYPISFLDFEWDLYPIPPYEGMRPMDVLLFQYSLDVYDGKKLKHYQYVGTGDDRREMAEELLRCIPDKGSILAYNARGAEKIRIRELAEYLPQYRSRFLNIDRRMFDLADPFINGMVYDTRMRGNFTLKVLEEIVDRQHSYHDLNVSNGSQAVVIHRRMETSEGGERENCRNDLLAYCGLDTYSLYEVLKWLYQLTGRKITVNDDCTEEII